MSPISVVFPYGLPAYAGPLTRTYCCGDKMLPGLSSLPCFAVTDCPQVYSFLFFLAEMLIPCESLGTVGGLFLLTCILGWMVHLSSSFVVNIDHVIWFYYLFALILSELKPVAPTLLLSSPLFLANPLRDAKGLSVNH